MTSEEWNRLFDLFHAAREKSGDERVMVLDAACGESTLLRRAVEELLREDEAADGFLSEPLFGSLRGEPRPSPIIPGQRLGRYVTVALIGRGGMGEVWSAQDTDLDRLVALKFLSSETLAGLDPQQITREAKAASALNHPGIVTIHEVVQSGTTSALVMELVEGKPLREACGKPMPIPEVLGIGTEIAEALAAAHAGGTIHGDIKPEKPHAGHFALHVSGTGAWGVVDPCERYFLLRLGSLRTVGRTPCFSGYLCPRYRARHPGERSRCALLSESSIAGAAGFAGSRHAG